MRTYVADHDGKLIATVEVELGYTLAGPVQVREQTAEERRAEDNWRRLNVSRVVGADIPPPSRIRFDSLGDFWRASFLWVENVWPQAHTPEGARFMCWAASDEYARWLRGFGFKAHVRNYVSHSVVRVGGVEIDWTARQFGEFWPFPTVRVVACPKK